jgi:uncharacterized damage-inducible protein DinB
MNNTITVFAAYNQAANAAVLALLNTLSADEREKDRGSYFKSLSGLMQHIGGATAVFCGMFKTALANTAAAKALEPVLDIKFPEGTLSEAQWKQLASDVATADKSLLDFCTALSAADLDTPVAYFTGNPPTVPLSFMLTKLAVHNTHHRGQVSQILDELKIDHDFSGISAAFI